MEEKKIQTIPQIIEEVKMEICEKICKYPDIWDSVHHIGAEVRKQTIQATVMTT